MRRLFPLFVFLIGTLTACGGSTPDPIDATDVVPEAELDPVALFPSDTIGMVVIDLEVLRQSPYYDTFDGWLDRFQEANSDRGDAASIEALARLSDQTQRVHVGFAQPVPVDDDPEIMVVMQGQYEPGELDTLLRLQERPESRVEQRGQHRVVMVGGEEGTTVDGRLMLVASQGRLDQMLARLEGRGGATPRSSDVLSDMGERVRFDGAPLGVVFEVTREIRAEIDRELRGDMPSSYRAMGARLDLSDGIDALAIADMETPQDATALADEVRGELQGLAGNPMVAALGLAALLESTRVTAEDKSFRFVLAADDGTTRNLLSRLDGFLTLALSASQAWGRDAVPPEPAPPAPETGSGADAEPTP